ncbi:MAG: hypothetical protein AB7F94_15035 [Nitrospira sp.]
MTRLIVEDWGLLVTWPSKKTHTVGRGATIAEQCDPSVGATTATTVSKKS